MDLVELRKKKKAETEAASKPPDDSSAPAEACDAEDAKPASDGGEEAGAPSPPGEGTSADVVPEAPETGLPFGEKGGREEERFDLLVFRVGGEEYGVRVEHLSEVIRPSVLTAVPRAPRYILGIHSLRGTIVPIFDLRRRLGLPDTPAAKTARIVVTKLASGLNGFLVDGIVGVQHVPFGNMGSIPDTIPEDGAVFLEGIARLGEKIVILLDVEKVVAVPETVDNY
ncbi:MAG: chemotaxis protein CheW [Nitrospirae bacterium]|nr:chemotaxis protein CheW [Nitrospirota bacterium]